MVVVERRNETTRTKRYDLSDPKLWQRIGPLMQVGFFALNSRVLAPHLPDDLLRHSKRFGDLSQERRKRLAAKLPKGEHAGKQRR